MSFVIAAPEMMATAAADLAGIESTLHAARAAAAASTTQVLAAGADDVSAAIAGLFSGHALDFQALSARAMAFHSQFMQTLTSAGSAYATAEAANAAAVGDQLLALINLPTNVLLGTPLIGNGTDGAPGSGQPGGPGGLLFGNGGNGGSGAPGQPGGRGGNAWFLSLIHI